jgi:hypothetical protein
LEIAAVVMSQRIIAQPHARRTPYSSPPPLECMARARIFAAA